MTQGQAVGQMIILLEAYYGVKYRDAVRVDLAEYLMEKSQDVAVALFEMVKRHHPTQYREPPCVAIFDKVYCRFEDDIFINLEHDGAGIKNKALMEPKPIMIERNGNMTDGEITAPEKAKEYFNGLKLKFKPDNISEKNA